MAKPSLLYASPFPPVKSGISAYSAAFVPALARYFDITLLTDDYELADETLRQRFGVLRYGRDVIDPMAFDHRVYNIGNQSAYHSYIYECALRWPGAVIMHDVVIYYLVADYYRSRSQLYSAMYALEGPRGIELLKRAIKAGVTLQPDLLPSNAELLEANPMIFVHSDYAREELCRRSPSVRARLRRLSMVNPSTPGQLVVDRPRVLARFGIPRDGLVLCSVGFIGPTKLNHEVCDVVEAANASGGRPVCYVMLGEGPYVDDRLGKSIIKTGFVNDEDFTSIIVAADLMVNFREPSMGETSASLLRGLAMGKRCIVNDAPWFAEFPAGVVIKIDNARRRENLLRVIDEWRAEPDRARIPVDEAIAYVRPLCASEAAAQLAAHLGVAGVPAGHVATVVPDVGARDFLE